MNLRERLARILHSATRKDRNEPPVVARAVVPHSNIPRQYQPRRPVDEPTVPLPPTQPRYQGMRADVKARNRQVGPQPAKPGTTRAAVGL